MLYFYLRTPRFHNLKADIQTFRIQVSPSLSDPESGFPIHSQAPFGTYSHIRTLLLQSRNPISTNYLALSAVVKISLSCDICTFSSVQRYALFLTLPNIYEKFDKIWKG